MLEKQSDIYYVVFHTRVSMYVNWKLIVLALLIVTIFLMSSSPSYVGRLAFAQESRANSLTDYKNPTYRIKLEYPSNWTKVEPNQTGSQGNLSLVIMLRTPITTNINSCLSCVMIIQAYNGSMPFEQFISNDLFTNLNQPQLHFHIVSKNTTNLAGAQASEVIFTYHTPNSDYKVLKIYEKIGSRIYTVAYNADSSKYDYYLPTIQKIIDSIKITK
jgi:hypothetical protein